MFKAIKCIFLPGIMDKRVRTEIIYQSFHLSSLRGAYDRTSYLKGYPALPDPFIKGIPIILRVQNDGNAVLSPHPGGLCDDFQVCAAPP